MFSSAEQRQPGLLFFVLAVDADGAVLIQGRIGLVMVLVFLGNVGKITALKLINPAGKFDNLLLTFILVLLHIQQLLLQAIDLSLHLFYYSFLAYQPSRQFFLPHPAPLQQLLGPLQLLHYKVKPLLLALIFRMAADRPLPCVGLMTDHEFDLRLHHAYNLIDMVHLILTRYLLPLEEIRPPDVPQEIVTDELILKAIRFLLYRTASLTGPSVFDIRGHSNCQINDINQWISQIICTYMKQDQQEELRDITLYYCDLRLDIKVPMNKILSEFFKRELKNYSQDFDRLAMERKVQGYVSLDKLRHYDVTLNTQLRGDNSILKSGLDFGRYQRDKKLRFYIHDQQNKQEESVSENNKTITLCLINGNVTMHEKRLDISGMRLDQFQRLVREHFNLDPTLNFNYMNMKDRTFISLRDQTSIPIKIFNQARITKVGIYPIFQAGCNDLYHQ